MDRKSKILLTVGGVLAFFVALPLFLYAVLSPSGTFEIRNRAQEASPSPTPMGSPVSSPSAIPMACNQADINKDGIVDITDYSILVANFFNSTGTCQ